jgi:glutathione synthase/RimK-type ligase-like ATP-grasp enzyme
LTTILIVTETDDIHAITVAEALNRRGAAVTLWATSDFPSRSDETAHLAMDGQTTVRIDGPDLHLFNPRFDVVWRRRPTYVLNTQALHPADRDFSDTQCSLFRSSLFQVLARDAFWVNPLEGALRAGSKLLQQEAARRAGLRIPETLFTNSMKEIRAFLARQGEVVYKPLSPGGWSGGEHDFLCYTTRVTQHTLRLVPEELLRQTPGIFQELVPKSHELRVTVMGRHVLTAKVRSQETQEGKLDWRSSYDELQMEASHLPPETEERCFALLDELGLVFGCLDFIVTPDGHHIFLEVNEMGQFLFVERYCGLPLLDAFSEFLLQAKVDFDWAEDRVAVRYTDPDLSRAAAERFTEFARAHVAVPNPLADEGITSRCNLAPGE